MRKRDKLKVIKEANQRLEEKWYHTLATTIALLAASQGELKAQSHQDSKSQETEQVTETKAQKEIKAMVAIGQDKSIPTGYGVGSSPSMAAAKKMALFNARKNLSEKGGDANELTIKGEVVGQNENGGFDYHILLGK
jgi:homoserine kinase